MSVARPLVLAIALVAAALSVVVWRLVVRRAAGNALTYSDLPFLLGVAGRRPDWDGIGATILAVAVAGLGIALAGVRINAPVPARDATIVICVDTSGSMASTDVAPTRSAAAAAAVRAFVDSAPAGTHVGIVAFSSGATVVQEPVEDREAARSAVDRIPFPNGGTAIGDALESAASLLPRAGARAIVLVTDGVNNAGGDPLAAAARIGSSGVRIETVGIGTNSGALIPGTGETAAIDEDALRAIAESGHGGYTRVEDAAALRGRLSGLARTTTMTVRRLDLSLPLAIAAGLLALVTALAVLAAGHLFAPCAKEPSVGGRTRVRPR